MQMEAHYIWVQTFDETDILDKPELFKIRSGKQGKRVMYVFRGQFIAVMKEDSFFLIEGPHGFVLVTFPMMGQFSRR